MFPFSSRSRSREPGGIQSAVPVVNLASVPGGTDLLPDPRAGVLETPQEESHHAVMDALDPFRVGAPSPLRRSRERSSPSARPSVRCLSEDDLSRLLSHEETSRFLRSCKKRRKRSTGKRCGPSIFSEKDIRSFARLVSAPVFSCVPLFEVFAQIAEGKKSRLVLFRVLTELLFGEDEPQSQSHPDEKKRLLKLLLLLSSVNPRFAAMFVRTVKIPGSAKVTFPLTRLLQLASRLSSFRWMFAKVAEIVYFALSTTLKNKKSPSAALSRAAKGLTSSGYISTFGNWLLRASSDVVVTPVVSILIRMCELGGPTTTSAICGRLKSLIKKLSRVVGQSLHRGDEKSAHAVLKFARLMRTLQDVQCLQKPVVSDDDWNLECLRGVWVDVDALLRKGEMLWRGGVPDVVVVAALQSYFDFQSMFLPRPALEEQTVLLAPIQAEKKKEEEVCDHLKDHVGLLNEFLARQPGLLTSSWRNLLRFPSLLAFESKVGWLRSRVLEDRQQIDVKEKEEQKNCLHIRVRRDKIIQDAFAQLGALEARDLKQRLIVSFVGEVVDDPLSSFFWSFSQAMVDPSHCLFRATCDISRFTLDPSSLLHDLDMRRRMYRFCGQVLGMAIYNEKLIECEFAPFLYNHFCGHPLTMRALEGIDPSLYKGLRWMLTPGNDVSMMGLTFSTQKPGFGSSSFKEIDLVPDGSKIEVTASNAPEFVRLVAEFHLCNGIKEQLNQLLEGLFSIIPRRWTSQFTPSEFERLVTAQRNLDIEDMRRNTEYVGYGTTDVVICWFWNWLASASTDEQLLFLRFVTGVSRVPRGGFGSLAGGRFNIHRRAYDFYNSNSIRGGVTLVPFPSSHTSFNQLDLPPYVSEGMLRVRLQQAVYAGTEGFGLFG